MIGWLLDTNVVAELANPHGVARVHAWAAAQDERRLHLSILTLGDYEKGLHNLPEGTPSDLGSRRRLRRWRPGSPIDCCQWMMPWFAAGAWSAAT